MQLRGYEQTVCDHQVNLWKGNLDTVERTFLKAVTTDMSFLSTLAWTATVVVARVCERLGINKKIHGMAYQSTSTSH